MKSTDKIFIIALMLSLILAAGTVVAADNMTFNQSDLKSVSNETDSEQSPNDVQTNSFHDLQILINNCTDGVVNLNNDYVYNNNTDFYLSPHDNSSQEIVILLEKSNSGIHINKPVVINGNGHSIDAQNMTRIFNINADNVVLKNITFLNAKCLNPNNNYGESGLFIGGHVPLNAVIYDSEKFFDTASYKLSIASFEGGAVYCSGNNLKITDSSFIRNIADLGGAIYIEGSNSQLYNLSFSNNTANEGGAVFIEGPDASILHSKFNSNNAYAGASIGSTKSINIQNCSFSKCNRRSVILYGTNWQINNMTSSYFNSFVKFPSGLDFQYELTHIREDYYNLKIRFGVRITSIYGLPLCNDDYGYSNNKSFCLNIDGTNYNLHTDGNSQAELNLKLSNGYCKLKAYNPITNYSITKSFNIGPAIYDYSTYNVTKIKKTSSKMIAKSKVFKKNSKSKIYSVILKSKDNKALKKVWIILKINGKLFKSKTNNNGKATIKIKLNKKGTFKSKITFKGNEKYKGTSKTVKIKIK